MDGNLYRTLASEWYERRRAETMTRFILRGMQMISCANTNTHKFDLMRNAGNTRRVFFIPPIQNRRVIAYEAGLKIQAVFYIIANFIQYRQNC